MTKDELIKLAGTVQGFKTHFISDEDCKRIATLFREAVVRKIGEQIMSEVKWKHSTRS